MGTIKQKLNDPFQMVEKSQFTTVVDILKSRLPRSGHVYNMALTLEKFPVEMKCFSLNGDLSMKSALIMIIFEREDYGQDINLSLPNEFQVTDEIKQAFISSKNVIDWEGAFIFVATDRRISFMIFEICTLVFKNSVVFNPNYSYWIDPEKVLRFDTKDDEDNDVMVKKLDEDVGLKFLVDNWKYAKPSRTEIYLKKIIKRHISAGVYYKGTLVSAAVVTGHGLIGVLHTDKTYRNKGYAVKCMKYLMKEMVIQGYVPCSTAQQENLHSLALHEKKLGMTPTHESDYIFHIPYSN